MSKKRPLELEDIYEELKKRGLLDLSVEITDIETYNKFQSEFFDKVKDIFTKPLPLEIQSNLKRIVKLASLKPGEIILDVGAGTGVLIPYFLPYKPKKIIACDLSPKMLANLKTKFPQVETYLMDVKDLPLPDNSINVAFLNAVWPNIGDKPAALKTLKKILKPHGRMIISHPEGKEFVDKLSQAMPFPLDPLPNKISLKRLLKKYGFILQIYIDEPKLYFILAYTEDNN